MSISVEIKTARERAGLNLHQLAKLAGVRYATVWDMERGKSRRVDLAVIDRLCAVLSVEPGDLLKREPKKRTAQKRRKS